MSRGTKHEEQSTPGGHSYSQILRSSSIIGGATWINYVIGLNRTKMVAVLLGPAGVGNTARQVLPPGDPS